MVEVCYVLRGEFNCRRDVALSRVSSRIHFSYFTPPSSVTAARNITVIILKAYTVVLKPSPGVEFSRIIVALTSPGFTRESHHIPCCTTLTSAPATPSHLDNNNNNNTNVSILTQLPSKQSRN
jgi:hypothetical protein